MSLELKPPLADGMVQIELFQDKEIRKELYKGEWYFSIIDVLEVLTDSPEPASYWAKIKSANPQLRPIPTKLKMPGVDGKKYSTECATPEQLFRIIQSVPSDKAEPIKRWLAKVGFERLEEIQNPELAIKRAAFIYQLHGRSQEWIDARMKGIAQRIALTDEWQHRGISQNFEFAELTALISEGTFGIVPQEHRALKGLAGNHKLRDHMTEVELVLTMLGEVATRNIAVDHDAFGFIANRHAAIGGGEVAGAARKALEQRTNTKAVSSSNYLTQRQKENIASFKERGFDETLPPLPLPEEGDPEEG
jgi:DNA-damage-inducible protein D